MDGRRRDGRLTLGLILCGMFALCAALGPLAAPYDPHAIVLERALQGPSKEHVLGTDALGRDLLSRTLWGARLAFVVCVLGVAGGAACGTALGLWVGMVGGIAERIVLRAVDVLLAFPGFLLALAAAAALGPGTENLIVSVGFFSFPPFVRVARAEASALMREEFVAAARAYGAPLGRVLWRHILPNAAGPLVALAALRMAAALTTASGLSFLGLGPPLPTADWGAMLDEGRAYLWTAPRLVVVPGAALFLSSIGFYLLGEGLSRPGNDLASDGR